MRSTLSSEALELLQQDQTKRPSLITEVDLDRLPNPVQRYLRYTQIPGKEPIRTIRLKQKGWFKPQIGKGWQPMTAEQYYTTNPPAFLWYGTIQLFPLLSVTGKDRFSDNHGNMIVKLLSFIPLVDARGPEVDQGELLRYLGEIAWFPTAWLSDCFEWQAIDDQSAQVTFRLQDITASAILHFNEQNQLIRFTGDRYWEEHGQYVLKPWSGYLSQYRELNGLWIPTHAEVTWHLDAGDFSYFRGEITEIDYNQVRPY